MHDTTHTVVFEYSTWGWIFFKEDSTPAHESFSCQTAWWRFNLIRKRISSAISIWSRSWLLVTGLVISWFIWGRRLGRVLLTLWSRGLCLLWVRGGLFIMLGVWWSVGISRRMLRWGRFLSFRSRWVSRRASILARSSTLVIVRC